MKLLRRSLANSFTFIVLLILIVGQGSLWTWFLFNQKAHTSAMLKNKIGSLGNLVREPSLDAILNSNYESLDRYIDGITKDGDIISIRITDKGGNVVREKSSGVQQRGKTINPFFVSWTNELTIHLKSGVEEIGTVTISYSGKQVNEAMQRLLTVPPLGQSLVFLITIYIIYLFFQRKIGKPVSVLEDRLRSITAGDLTVKIPDIGKNELGTIAHGLRFLVDGMTSTVSKLHSTAANVAMAIRQLQLTFDNVTQGVQKQSTAVDSISQSLKNAHESQKKITDGTEKMSEVSSENVTSLLQMKNIADEIASSASRLFQASESSFSIVAEMSQTAKAMADSSENVLSSVEDALASVEEINASVKEVETGAKESTRLADKVREITAEKGVLQIADAIESMEKISDKVKYSVEIVRRLGSRSKDIEKMLSVIKEVTEQTNLLSLNAAILAAQAGEYGKGFSVVADEIRALSDRTASSTKEITGIVRTIQTELSDAVVSIETGMQMVDEGNTLVYKAGESVATALEVAQKSARMARSIEKATEEQAKGLGHITTSVSAIKEMVSGVAKSTNEQSKSSEYMLESIREVKEVAEVSKKGTAEQATGTKLISKNLELAAEKLFEITQSTMNQQKVNEGIISHVEQIRNIGTSTLRDVEALSLSLNTLQEEIGLLKKEMEAFKIK
ncbi:MAG: HAMP domain-containing protein [Nitrospirae bacterium]|nr:HAMP domain-containing protein [Nitrospirota bacterium]